MFGARQARYSSPAREAAIAREIAIGLIIFGFLAIGGTIDGARRKLIAQPDWIALNWRSYAKGLVCWLVAGGIAVIAGVLALLL